MLSARPLTSAALAAVLFALAGCPSATLLPDEQRNAVISEYEGKRVFLRPSMYVLPFFSDPTNRLLSALPPDSIHLLDDTKGSPILPGQPEAVLPVGTRAQIQKVEFPTSFAVTKRPLYSPRTSPWVYLAVEGRKVPCIVVLRPGLRTREEFHAVMEQIFTDEDPAPALNRYPPEIRTAINEKRLASGMDPDAVTLAWGRPERIQQKYEESVKVETWTWPLGKRTATFRDERLVETTPALEKKAEP